MIKDLDKYMKDGEPSICFVIRRLFDYAYNKEWSMKYDEKYHKK